MTNILGAFDRPSSQARIAPMFPLYAIHTKQMLELGAFEIGSPHDRQLQSYWYGGEPLLNVDL